MDQNIHFLLLLAALTATIGVGAALAIYLARRLTSVECPHCFVSIPKHTAVNEVPCPECGVEPEGYTPLPAENCCRCKSNVDCVSLWDGESYCKVCLDEHAPELVEVRELPLLSEELPLPALTIARRMFVFAFLTALGFATFIAILVGVLSGDWQKAMQGFAVIMLCFSPVVVLWTGFSANSNRLLRLKVSVWNRKLIVRVGTQLIVAPLAECVWWSGKVSQMTVWNLSFLLKGSAIVVEVPKHLAKEGNRIAVGLRPPMRATWESFFNLSGIPEQPPKPSLWSRVFKQQK
jgi:hypothetical protein